MARNTGRGSRAERGEVAQRDPRGLAVGAKARGGEFGTYADVVERARRWPGPRWVDPGRARERRRGFRGIRREK